MFRELKEWFMGEQVLVVPDLNKKMQLEVDTSDYAMGKVLSMKCEDRLWRPVAFLLKFLKNLLEGAQFKFEIWIDHKNLEYFMKVQKLNYRQVSYAGPPVRK